jgi:WD40 repeat protein
VPTVQLFCHPTNENLILTSSEDKCLRIWDARTKRPVLVSQKFDYLNIGWNSDGSKILGVREDSRKYVDILEILDARTLEPERCECVTEGSSVLSLAWSATQPDTFFTVTNKSSSMLPFVTMIEMHQLTASGIARRCAVPAHPEPCTDIDMQCDCLGKTMITVSRDKDKDSDDRTDDCIIAIWDMETLAVTANIMDADDYKNLACSIQPKGGLIAVGGLSDIKVRSAS